MNNFFLFLKSKITFQNIVLIILCLSYLIVAYLQSIVQHQQFLTSNWDLGFHNQLMYKFAHFKNPSTTLWSTEYSSMFFLGDHATFLMPINSQMYWIFGSSTLLVVQILYGLIGSLGIYKLIEYKFQSANFALTGVFLFFTHYSLYAALDFDDHDNVYGVMFLPWILYFYYKDNFKWFLISLVIFLLAREDLALTAIMIGLCFLIFDWRTKWKYGIVCLAISAIYFLFVYKIIIPYFSPLPDGGYTAWRFSELGDSITEVIIKIIINPSKIISLMFNTIEKQEKLKYFLYTGGFFFIVRPKYFLLVVPTFFITCLSSGWTLWGNMYHYNILFAILLPYVVISTATLFSGHLFKIIFIIFAICCNLFYLNKNILRDGRTFGRIFTYAYYTQRNNLREIQEGINIIPKNASVSANNYYTPHLAFREKVYFFPNIGDAKYIFINEEDGKNRFYPFESSEHFFESVRLLQKEGYEIIFNKKQIIVFRKKL